MACVLQGLCTTRGSPAAQAQQPPSHQEEQNHHPQKMHTQSCLASFFYNTRTCCNGDHAAPSPRSSPARAQQPGARPEVSIVSERRNASFRMTPRLAMIDTQQHPPTGSTMKWKAQKNSARAVPSGGISHSPPQSSLPGQWRRRRISLVVVKSVHKYTEMQPMCVLRTQLTTATKASMIQAKSSRSSVAVQQLDDVVDDAALQRLLPLRLHVTRQPKPQTLCARMCWSTSQSGRLVMRLHEAQHSYGQLLGKRTPGTALSACTLAMVADIRTTREKGKSEAMCLECACQNQRRHPSAPRASRALQGPGRRCTSAARRAILYKTAPASCRRPGTRTGRR